VPARRKRRQWRRRLDREMEQEVRNAKQHGKYETLERLAKKKRKKWKDNNNKKVRFQQEKDVC
jgi:hypothetical protein